MTMRPLVVVPLMVVLLLGLALWGAWHYLGWKYRARLLRCGTPSCYVATDAAELGIVVKASEASVNNEVIEALERALAMGRVVRVPDGEEVESVTFRYFGEGRFLDNRPPTDAAMQAAGVILVEKVRVVAGPAKGSEGWIPGSQLQKLLVWP